MRRVVVAAVVAAVLWPALARANGRFPASVSVAVRPGDRDDIYLGTTFGLLISHDDGATFHWACEDAIGYSGTFDPKVEIAADGTIYATTFDGLRVSRDGGCTFQLATEDRPATDPGRFAGKWVDAIDLGPNGEVWVATAEGGLPNEVYRSTDGGHTFTPAGLESPEIWWKSLLVAPSGASRVYVTGYQVSQVNPDGGPTTPVVHVRRSDDAGAHWAPVLLDGIQLANAPLIRVEAVSPSDRDVVYARSEGAAPPAGDLLYRSKDGGASWQLVLTTTDAIRGVVFRQDGTVMVATVKGGVFTSTDGVAFTPVATPPEMACLAERADGTLLACGANWSPDNFALGRSTDGAAWTKVFRFVELDGPLTCPAAKARTRCDELWPALQTQLGIPVPIVADMPGPPAKGCDGCAASGAGAAAAGLAAAVAMVVGLRRRRDCCR